MKDYKNNQQALFDDLGKSESLELEWALMHLYRELHPKVRHYIMKNSGSETDVSEILNAGLTDMYYQRQQGKLVNKNLYGLLMRICQYKWLNKLNKKKSLVLVIDEEESPVKRKLAAMECTDDMALEREKRLNCVRKKIQGLVKSKREILMDKYFGALSLKEIAQKYDTTVGNIKNVLHRTRHELRSLVSDCLRFSI